MNLRSLVATSTLVALLAIPLLGQGTYVTDPLAHWGAFWGMGSDWYVFAAAGAATCATLAVVGAVVCGIVGMG
ncbi:MAG: hypothetical protein OXH75_15090 [Acidobacteria bacterium]|nr:hypothetical protein [Acidobacteriota bacterium]